jgi:hypothetical protein
MEKMRRTFILLFLAFVLFSCKNLVTDLPITETTNYIFGNTVTFPRGTKAIDIYNTVVSIYGDNEYNDITDGIWKRIKITTVDGLPRQEWEMITFNKIRHTHSKHESGVNTYTVYLYEDNVCTKEIVFEWQRQTTNVWKNEVIEGDVTFTF